MSGHLNYELPGMGPSNTFIEGPQPGLPRDYQPEDQLAQDIESGNVSIELLDMLANMSEEESRDFDSFFDGNEEFFDASDRPFGE